jgi:hypothetical protein
MIIHFSPLEEIQESVDDQLKGFDESLCGLTAAKLCKWKKDYLCCCKPECMSFSSSLSSYKENVENFSMDSFSSEALVKYEEVVTGNWNT